MSSTIYQGDCRAVLASLPAHSIDGVVTDPPYGIGYRPRRTAGQPDHPWRRIAGDAAFDPDFYADWLQKAHAVMKPDTHIYVFCSDYHLGVLRSLVAAAGFKLKRTIVWEKNAWTMGDTGGDYGHMTEFIVFAHKGRRRLEPPRHGNVFRFPKVSARQMLHPTEKPVPLLRLLIRKSVPEGGVILDPFAGSGSTGVAALAEGRSSLLVESDPSYFEVMRRRLAGSLEPTIATSRVANDTTARTQVACRAPQQADPRRPRGRGRPPLGGNGLPVARSR